MKPNGSKRQVAWLLGLGIGAALMYFLDPKGGARRRHLAKDKATRTIRAGRWQLRKAAEDVKNHGLGAVHELSGRVRERFRGGGVPDDVLVARVRAALGHHAAHAGAIEVMANGGAVTLRGPVEPHKLHELIRAAARVRGVREVRNRLQDGAGK